MLLTTAHRIYYVVNDRSIAVSRMIHNTDHPRLDQELLCAIIDNKGLFGF